MITVAIVIEFYQLRMRVRVKQPNGQTQEHSVDNVGVFLRERLRFQEIRAKTIDPPGTVLYYDGRATEEWKDPPHASAKGIIVLVQSDEADGNRLLYNNSVNGTSTSTPQSPDQQASTNNVVQSASPGALPANEREEQQLQQTVVDPRLKTKPRHKLKPKSKPRSRAQKKQQKAHGMHTRWGWFIT